MYYAIDTHFANLHGVLVGERFWTSAFLLFVLVFSGYFAPFCSLIYAQWGIFWCIMLRCDFDLLPFAFEYPALVYMGHADMEGILGDIRRLCFFGLTWSSALLHCGGLTFLLISLLIGQYSVHLTTFHMIHTSIKKFALQLYQLDSWVQEVELSAGMPPRSWKNNHVHKCPG